MSTQNSVKMIDFVIITALDLERNALISYIPNLERIVNKGRIYYKGKIYNGTDNHLNIVILSLPYMGNVNASIATSQAIAVWNPRYIILTGITGGFKKDGVHLGDLIIGEQVVYYESGKMYDKHHTPRYQVQPTSMELLNHAHNLKIDDWVFDIKLKAPTINKYIPKVHFGVIATGEKVISTNLFGDEFLKIWPKALGVEMEAYGTALAAYQSENRPGFLFIKSISDWADNEKNDKWQFFAAHAAAAYTVRLLKSIIGSAFNLHHDREQPKKVEQKILNGKVKICICRDLLDDWNDLADYFDIPLNHRKRFLPGRECQGIWEWLEVRKKLEEIIEALKFIRREDLLRCTD